MLGVNRCLAIRIPVTKTMNRIFRPAIFLPALALFSAAPASPQSGRFDHCPRPVAPACVNNLATYKTEAGKDRCAREIKRFLDMTFAYRKCMNGQLENEIRETNRVNDMFKCLMKGAKACP